MTWRSASFQPQCAVSYYFLQYFRDRYEIEDRMLGKGQYGTVFLSKEVSTKKQLACKVIDLDLAIQNLTSQSGTAIPHGRWEEKQFAKAQKKRGTKECFFSVFRKESILISEKHGYVSCFDVAVC